MKSVLSCPKIKLIKLLRVVLNQIFRIYLNGCNCERKEKEIWKSHPHLSFKKLQNLYKINNLITVDTHLILKENVTIYNCYSGSAICNAPGSNDWGGPETIMTKLSYLQTLL